MSVRIVAKGNYTHGQAVRFLSVKQFLIAEEDGKRYLLLRFFNGGKETVTSFRAKLTCYGEEGKIVGKGEYVYKGAPALPNAEFGPVGRIPVGPACIDVRVDVLSVRSRDYVYEVKKNSVAVRYLPEEEPPDREQFERKMGGKRCRVLSGTKRAVTTLLLLTFLLMGAIGAASLFRAAGGRSAAEEPPSAETVQSVEEKISC